MTKTPEEIALAAIRYAHADTVVEWIRNYGDQRAAEAVSSPKARGVVIPKYVVDAVSNLGRCGSTDALYGRIAQYGAECAAAATQNGSLKVERKPTKLEHVAQRICAARLDDGTNREIAQSAIGALKAPEPHIVQAGAPHLRSVTCTELTRAFDAMLDAILAEGGK